MSKTHPLFSLRFDLIPFRCIDDVKQRSIINLLFASIIEECLYTDGVDKNDVSI